MGRLWLLAATIAGAGVLAAPVLGADALQVPVSSNAAVPVADDTGFDWNGFYAGIYGVAQSSPLGGFQYGAGLAVGANAAFDFFLVGGEVAFLGLTGGAGSTSYVQVLGKGGLILTDDVAVYGAAGYGLDTGAPVQDQALVGAGVELALTDDVTVRAQYLHGFPITGANPIEQVTVGANLHF